MRYLSGVATLFLDPALCNGCGTCTQVCPHGVLALENGAADIIDRDLCMECGACARNCPTGAIRVDAGVGCAAAVLNSALGRSGSCCSLDHHQDGCGCGDSVEDPAPSGKSGRSCCC